MHHPEIMQIFTGKPWELAKKTINKKNVTYLEDAASNDGGFNTIRNLRYNVENISDNILMLHVTYFDAEKPEDEGIYKTGIPASTYKNKRIFGMNEIRRARR